MLHEKIKFEPDGRLIVKHQIDIKGMPYVIEIEYSKENEILGVSTKNLAGETIDYTGGDLRKLEEKRAELELMGLKIENIDNINRLDANSKI